MRVVFLLVVVFLTITRANIIDDDKTVASNKENPITPALKQRLLRLHELSAMPTVNQLLQMQQMLEEGYHDEARVIKRIKGLLVKYEQQIHSMCNQFLVSPVTESTSSSLTETVLFLMLDDHTLFLKYMTPREQHELKKAVARYRKLPWPLNKEALEDAVKMLTVARTTRDMVNRLSVMEVYHGELVETTLRKLHTIAKKRTGKLHGNREDARAELQEELEHALFQFKQVGLVDKQDMLLILGLWDYINQQE
jgi:hypothetical protein